MTKWMGFVAPEIDPDNRFFWDGVAQDKVLLRNCEDCGRSTLPPTVNCPYCASDRWHPTEASGDGTLYSWVVCTRAMDPAFADDAPYTIVMVNLAEGARLYGRLVNDEVSLRDGMPMKLEFVDAGPERRRFFAFRAIDAG